MKEQEKIVVRSEDVPNHHLVPAERGHLTGKDAYQDPLIIIYVCDLSALRGKRVAACLPAGRDPSNIPNYIVLIIQIPHTL